MKNNKIFRISAVVLAVVIVFGCCCGCVMQGERNPSATVKFSDGTEIVIRLYYDKAPNTVKNFISLAESGFYDGLEVYRVVKYALVQMGDPNNDGTGNAGYYIEGEFPNNGYKKNDLTHSEGMVSMARLGSSNNDADYYDTASSSFFITLGNKTELDGDYAVFGKVIRGYEDFEKLGQLEVNEDKKPFDTVTIESVTVETYGKNIGQPKTIAIEE